MKTDWVKIGENDFTKVELFHCPKTRMLYVLRRGEKVAEFRDVTEELIQRVKKEVLTINK